MKKVFSMLMVIAVVTGVLLSLAACGGGSSTPKPGIIDGAVTWVDEHGGTGTAGNLPEVGVIVTAWDANDQKIGSAPSRSDGRFTINNVPPGTYTVTGQAPASSESAEDKRWVVTGVTVLSEKTKNVDMDYQNSVGANFPAKYLQ